MKRESRKLVLEQLDRKLGDLRPLAANRPTSTRMRSGGFFLISPLRHPIHGKEA